MNSCSSSLYNNTQIEQERRGSEPTPHIPIYEVTSI